MKAFLNHPIWGRDGSRGIYLIPIFGVCIVGILWLAVLNMLANEERSTVAAAMSSAEGIASTFEHRTVRAIRDADRTALLIKYLFERDGSVDVDRIIKNGLIPGDAYLLVSMTDARGQVIATSEPRAMAIQVSERDYFQRHAAQDTAHLDISKPTILRISGKTAIQLTRRLNDPNGRFAGIVLLSVDPNYFTNSYEEETLGSKGALGLLGRDGIYRARRVGNDTTGFPDGEASNVLARSQIATIGGFEGVSPVDGVTRFVAYRVLDEFPLIVFAGKAKDEALGDFYGHRKDYIAATSVASVAILVFFALIATQAMYVARSRKRAWARARELGLASKVYETTADAIVVSDAQDRVVMVNRAFSRMTGFGAEEIVGRRLESSPFRSLDPAELAIRMQKLHRDGFVTGEILRARKDASELPLWITATCVYDDDGSVMNYIRVFTDISALKASQLQLEQLASRDALTGLLNRRMFHARLDEEVLREKRWPRGLALLFIDLDSFKAVNDRFGHDVGDQLLQEVSRRLLAATRATDFVFRVGGDEFTAILAGTTVLADAIAVANRILHALRAPLAVDDCVTPAGASIGIAVYPQDGTDAGALIKAADVAMYRAKKSGRNQYALCDSHDSTALTVP
jgi:diguanylate cyclase (GGDEF)-like protein/PAS domain S-box-containing protein